MKANPRKLKAPVAFVVPALGALLALFAWLPMTWQQQLVFGAVVVCASLVISRVSSHRRTTHFLMMLSICVSMRYAWFRIASLDQYLRSPWSTPDFIDASFMILLLAAEVYSLTILLLGYLQGIAPLQRRPEPLPENIDEWPTVDVFIPTYNEPLDLVRTTALGATAVDWPADRLRVVILDDGEREEFREFAAEAGIDYVARTEHSHAKAGNINHALQMSTAEYVAIFDSDHIPTRSFLQMTLGWFLRDPKLGMLQTPHHFYSPDPVERNLDHFRVVPNEGELFYGVIQDGNDLWNATFFCGSCAVIRRSALEEVGGIAVETVTEDAHTSLRMQMKGWNTAYLNSVQAAGLATESVSAHVRQRTRWARGMIQILRTDNPLFARGLKPAQRLCYLNAMLHFLYAAPRLIFLASPLLYLLFDRLNMPGYWVAILAFAAPHLVLSTVTNSRIQGEKRHTFWNEVYETILSPYILFPTWLALVNPRYGKFNVTTKGSQQDDHFDARIGWPFLMLLFLNFAGLAMAVPRYLYWNVEHRGTVLMNVLWTVFNIVILGVTVAVCYERRQRRGAVRIAARIPVRVTAEGSNLNGFSQNVSSTGMALLVTGKWKTGQQLAVSFDELETATPIHVRVTGQTGNLVRVHFGDLNVAEQLTITRVIYSRADRWLDWNKGRQNDHLLRSFLRVLKASLVGLKLAVTVLFQRRKSAANSNGALAPAGTSAAALLMLYLLFPQHALASHARPVKNAEPVRGEQVHFEVAGASYGAGILLNQQTSSAAVRVVLPSTLLIESGQLALRYKFAAGSRREDINLQVSLNGNVIASLIPSQAELAVGESKVRLPLPVDVFVQDSKLSFDLTGANGTACGTRSGSTDSTWVRIDPASGIDVYGRRLAIADDLSLLPEPFVRRGTGGESAVPVVFAGEPDAQVLRAAGIAASWLGMQAQDRSPRFNVLVGSLPAGNAVLILAGSQQIAGIKADNSPSVRMVTSPADAMSKLLILSAPRPDQLVQLAQTLATNQLRLEGSTAKEMGFTMPSPRKPDDAPAWVQGNRVELLQLQGAESLKSSVKDGALLYMRLAPDLTFGSRNNAYLSLHYTASPGPLDPASNVAVSLNGLKADSVPLHSTTDGATETVNIAVGELPFLFRNTLTARLYPVAPGAGPCAGIPNNFKGSISGGSYLDVGNAIHLARLPELRSFSNAGFPFTQYADLGHTAVLLPRQSGPSAIALYLDMLGYFGAQTGYPALQVSVAFTDTAADYADKDLLVIGTYADASRIPGVAGHLAVKPWLGKGSLPLIVRWSLDLQRLLRLSNESPERVSNEAAASQGLIEAAGSPLQGGRSLIVVAARNEDDLNAMSGAMLESMPLDDIHGRTSLWNGSSFHSYDLVGRSYLIGDTPLLRRLEFWMEFYPWFPALMLLAVCGLAAGWIEAWVVVKRHARLRGAVSNQGLEA